MKFICDNCKAKYQIGDDKIAGRSVRMKCRRCGHLIQLATSVTAGDAGPMSGDPSAAPHDLSEASFVESNSSASMALKDLLAAQPPDDLFEEGPTRAMTLEQRAAAANPAATLPVAAPPPVAPAARPPPAGAAPRPAFGAVGATPSPGAAARPAPGAPGLGAARPVAGPGLGAARPARPGAAVPGPTAARPGAPAATTLPAGGVPGVPDLPARPAATGAFQRAVGGGPAAPANPPGGAGGTSHVPHGEDWYVGVAGVPIGPVRLAVIREKALTGAVHPESLVWREGFDEWAPLKGFPELLEIVQEAQAARGAGVRRPSAVPPPPTRPSVLPPVVAPPAARAPGAPGAPAAYQPKATAIGVGIPAASLPAKAPQGPGAAPAPPLTTKSGVPALTPRPAGAVPPLAAARPGAPAARPGLAARPIGAPRAPVPGSEATRPSSPGLATPPPFFPEPAAPASSAAPVVPGPEPATDDLFGLGGGGSAAAHPAPSAPEVTPPPAAAPVAVPVSMPAAAPPAPGTPVPAGALDVMRDPFAAPPPASGANGSAAASAAAAAGALAVPAMLAPVSVPAASTPAAAEIAPGAPSSRAASDSLSRASVVPPLVAAPPSELDEVLPRRRQGLHPLAYAFIAMAAAFGGVVAFLLFSKPAQPTIVYVQQGGPGTAGPGTTAVAAPGDTGPAAPPTGGVPTAEPSSGPKPVSGGGKGPIPTATPTGTSAPLDTSGFVTQVVPGPTATATGTGGDPSLGQLSAGEIQGVVGANQPRIRKRCWQPALDSAGPNASGNARVKGKIVIGASGAVQSASASGAEKDYPGLSSCIAGQMQGWKFPPSSGSTPVDVPFVFAGQ